MYWVCIINDPNMLNVMHVVWRHHDLTVLSETCLPDVVHVERHGRGITFNICHINQEATWVQLIFSYSDIYSITTALGGVCNCKYLLSFITFSAPDDDDDDDDDVEAKRTKPGNRPTRVNVELCLESYLLRNAWFILQWILQINCFISLILGLLVGELCDVTFDL